MSPLPYPIGAFTGMDAPTDPYGAGTAEERALRRVKAMMALGDPPAMPAAALMPAAAPQPQISPINDGPSWGQSQVPSLGGSRDYSIDLDKLPPLQPPVPREASARAAAILDDWQRKQMNQPPPNSGLSDAQTQFNAQAQQRRDAKISDPFGLEGIRQEAANSGLSGANPRYLEMLANAEALPKLNPISAAARRAAAAKLDEWQASRLPGESLISAPVSVGGNLYAVSPQGDVRRDLDAERQAKQRDDEMLVEAARRRLANPEEAARFAARQQAMALLNQHAAQEGVDLALAPDDLGKTSMGLRDALQRKSDQQYQQRMDELGMQTAAQRDIAGIHNAGSLDVEKLRQASEDKRWDSNLDIAKTNHEADIQKVTLGELHNEKADVEAEANAIANVKLQFEPTKAYTSKDVNAYLAGLDPKEQLATRRIISQVMQPGKNGYALNIANIEKQRQFNQQKQAAVESKFEAARASLMGGMNKTGTLGIPGDAGNSEFPAPKDSVQTKRDLFNMRYGSASPDTKAKVDQRIAHLKASSKLPADLNDVFDEAIFGKDSSGDPTANTGGSSIGQQLTALNQNKRQADLQSEKSRRYEQMKGNYQVKMDLMGGYNPDGYDVVTGPMGMQKTIDRPPLSEERQAWDTLLTQAEKNAVIENVQKAMRGDIKVDGYDPEDGYDINKSVLLRNYFMRRLPRFSK